MGMGFTVVPHVHWDREWYFTQQKSQLYLSRYLSDVLDGLDADPRITQYLFDAQTSLIDDYLADHPEREEQVKRLVSERRLLTGPWYTQCDQMVVHGESIVRNLVYGTREAEAYGHCFNVDYAPDCFGQAAQMPQILGGFGIPFAMFKRGIDTSAIPADDFIWESEDGSRVYAYHLLDYLNFRAPVDDVEKNVELAQKLASAYEPRSLSGHAFLFNGFDQHPLRRDIADVVEAMAAVGADVSFGDLEDVLAQMAATENLPVYRGELTSGETTRVHKSIYSSRADLKTLNSKVENELVRIAEPLQAIFHDLTGRQERNLLKRAWKLIMQNSAHDSIGCCNSDEVNRAIEARFTDAATSVSEFEKIVYRQIAEGAETEPFGFQAYNFLPYDREEEVRCTLLSPWTAFALVDSEGNWYPVEVISATDVTAEALGVAGFVRYANNSAENPYGNGPVYSCEIRTILRVPAMGYETFRVVEAEAGETASTSDVLENEFLRVTANADGTLEVTDKRTGHVYHDVLELVDDIDAGDSYDWSDDPAAPFTVSSKGGSATIDVAGQTMRISTSMVLPANRDERIRETVSATMPVELTVSLPVGKPVLEVTARIANTAVDHRLRALVHADIPSEFSHADQAFGLIDRPTRLAGADTWRERGWDERPRTIEPMQSLCYLEGDGRIVEVITDSVKEYQVVGDEMDTLAYTLFRSFTKMGRADLPDRPGRASGKEWDTPDAALLKDLAFTFAVAFPQNVSDAVALAAAYTTPIRIHQRASFDMCPDEFVFGGFSPAVPQRVSMLSVEGDVQTSIVKLAEDEGAGTILRVTALSEGAVAVHTDKHISITNLAENADQPLDAARIYKKNQIVTIRIKED